MLFCHRSGDYVAKSRIEVAILFCAQPLFFVPIVFLCSRPAAEAAWRLSALSRRHGEARALHQACTGAWLYAGRNREPVEAGSADTRELAAHKVALIERKLIDLAAMRDALSALVRQCDTGQVETSCPIIRALARDD